MHQCRDALLWCIITVMHYRNNASTLWCIKHMCQCDLLYIMFYWYDGLRCSVMKGWCMVWCVGMQCDEWVMHSMMQCVMNGWCMGDAWVVWCEWMNEWTNEWMNEWMNEWWINECVGYVEWPCAFCCILTVFVICLSIFSGLFILTNKHHIHPRTSVCRSRTNPTCNIGAQWVRLWVLNSSLVVIG